VLKGHESGVELIVGRTVTLLEAWVFRVLALATLEHSSEVESWEDTVVGNNMVFPVGLEVIEVLETSSIGVTKEEGQESVSIINGIELLSFHKVFQVVLDYWFLVNSSSLGSCSVNINTITEGENILIFLVLKSEGVNTDHTSLVGKSGVNQFLLGFTGGVNNSWEEVLFNSFSSIDISEYCDFLSEGIILNFNHLITKVDINTSLVAFVEDNLIGVRELVDFLVRGPELDSSVFSSSSL
jgi:hypothetical protein